jgi:hypothetical protein
MNRKNMWKPAAIGGILLGVLSSMPYINYLNLACCAWVIGGGVLAAYLYVKESPAMVTLGQGVILGLLTGVIGTVIVGLFYIPLLLMSSSDSLGFAEQLRKMMDQLPWATNEDRQAFIELTSRKGFVTILYIASMVFQLAIDCLMSMLGGTLGVAIFEKRKPGDPFSQAPGSERPATLPPPPPPE